VGNEAGTDSGGTVVAYTHTITGRNVMPKLLLLSSNPRRDLNLDREISDLTRAVQRLGKFEIALGLGVSAQELPALLAEHSPQIVHFCGHGAGDQGLLFQDENGREQLVSTEVLTRIFKTFANEINCTVLNACDSDRQAEAIVEHINYVIGMSQPILDKAAHLFAVGFYKGLAAEKSIEQAYEMGCIAIQIWSETNSQSTQSRQYRKAEYVGEVKQLAQPPLAEYLKPVLLKKSEHKSSGLAVINLVPETQLESAPSNPPQEFVEYVQQEADRKEYKDRARDVYDNFGQFSSEKAADLSKSEYKQRQILLGKVKQFWIEGFLQPSLQNTAALSLDLKARPDAIADLSQGIEALSVELDSSYERLQGTQIYEEMGQGRTLLILGSPGAGKTIALLQLAQRLIERSEQNLSLPMPIVFNLSSWAKDRKTIVDWLIDELLEKYQVPKSLSEPWIRQQQIIPLLDGLDEVNADYRNDCVRALNEFIGLFPQTEVAVCSRVRDYEALIERLQISSALCLQPLSPKQVYQFLDSVGGALAGLKMLLQRESNLEQFAQTPLILNFMSMAYQGWSVEKLMHELRSVSDRNQHLFDTYIDRRLDRGATPIYTKDQVQRWLSWLATQMLQEKRTIFLIEKMQPNWLRNRGQERVYRIKTFILSSMIAGMIAGMSTGISTGVTIGMTFGFLRYSTLKEGIGTGLVFALGVGLITGIITGISKGIVPLEKFSWSWRIAKSRLARELFVAVCFGLIIGLILTMVVSLNAVICGKTCRPDNPSISLAEFMLRTLEFGLPGSLIFGLFFGLGSGIGSSEIERRTIPNQGIHSSWRNALIVWLFVGLIFGLILALAFGGANGLHGLVVALALALIFGMKYGGTACVQHFTLRKMLHQKGDIPWNYAKFLDFASDRLLMKKIGGGYVFFHRMLLEHFAQKIKN
jgi:MFS family permease